MEMGFICLFDEVMPSGSVLWVVCRSILEEIEQEYSVGKNMSSGYDLSSVT